MEPSTKRMRQSAGRVVFSVTSEADVKAMSVLDFDGIQAKAFRHRLRDPLLGPEVHLCPTCRHNPTRFSCSGHYGSVTLATPVVNPAYVREIHALLRQICPGCLHLRKEFMGDLPLSSEGVEEETRQQQRASKKRGRQPDACYHCGVQLPTGIKRVGGRFQAVLPGAEHRDVELSASEIRRVFARIPEAHRAVVNVVDPASMIWTVLPIPPISIRPTGSRDGHQVDDDLTFRVADILRTNLQLACLLREQQNPRGREVVTVGPAPPPPRSPEAEAEQLRRKIRVTEEHLMNYMTLYINEKLLRDHQPRGTAAKSLVERLKGKQGRIRQNLQGKRVNYSSHGIISGDPSLATDELGVPEYVCLDMTTPETVTPFNIRMLQQLVNNGKDRYPGANYVVKEHGYNVGAEIYHNLRVAAPDAPCRRLEPGDVVERQMRDGDRVFFNRQPTLHQMSFQSFTVRFIKDHCTYRLPLSVTRAFNADFDGDEMNMHVPQSELTRSETDLMRVQNNLMSKNARPTAPVVQDALLALNLMLQPNQLFERGEAMDAITAVHGLTPWYDALTLPFPCVLAAGRPRWSGKQLFSLLIPPGLSATWRAAEGEDHCCVVGGDLVTGIPSMDGKGSGILDLVNLHCPNREAIAFLDAVYRLGYWHLGRTAFSVSVRDFGPLPRAARTCGDAVATFQRLNEVRAAPAGRETGPPLQIAPRVLMEHHDDLGADMKRNLSPDNNLQLLQVSKGSWLTLRQIALALGQQLVEGVPAHQWCSKRLPEFNVVEPAAGADVGSPPEMALVENTEQLHEVLAEGRYILPPVADSFVTNGYRHGLTAPEFFYHSMDGRVGLVDTAVKTAVTGYNMRRMIKFMESVRLEYDGSAVLWNNAGQARGTSLQLLYGGSPFVPQRLVRCPPPRHCLTEEAFEARCILPWTPPEEARLLRDGFLGLRRAPAAVGGPLPPPFAAVEMPCDVDVLLHRATDGVSGARRKATYEAFRNADPEGRTTWARRFYERELQPFFGSVLRLLTCYAGQSEGVHHEGMRTTLVMLRMYLNTATLLPLGLDPTEGGGVQVLFRDVVGCILAALSSPGANVGVVAAEEIGEPSTQMTLNNFHQAGTGDVGGNVLKGIARQGELINSVRNQHSGGVVVLLRPEVVVDRARYWRVIRSLRCVTLAELTAGWSILYDQGVLVSDYPPPPTGRAPVLCTTLGSGVMAGSRRWRNTGGTC